MIPNQRLTGNITQDQSIRGSRAYTFLDSYIYMRNQRYNALYAKNREILMIENQAIHNRSVGMLYDAFVEQVRILDSIVVRIRNFAMNIKQDVLENIDNILPTTDEITEFSEIYANTPYFPRMKIIQYKIPQIKYDSMVRFYDIFEKEVKDYLAVNNNTVPINDPIIRNKASDYLRDKIAMNTTYEDSLINTESITLITTSRINAILMFLKNRNVIRQEVNNSFRTFLEYLRGFRTLDKLVDAVKPEVYGNYVKLSINPSYKITFNDYLVLYKHVSSIIKYLMETVSYYDNKFFNKLYAIQSNISIYDSVLMELMNYYYANENKPDIQNEDIGVETLFNTTLTADMLLMDSINDVDVDDISDNLDIDDEYYLYITNDLINELEL